VQPIHVTKTNKAVPMNSAKAIVIPLSKTDVLSFLYVTSASEKRGLLL
jgi:hypothetical protein